MLIFCWLTQNISRIEIPFFLFFKKLIHFKKNTFIIKIMKLKNITTLLKVFKELE